MNNKEFIAELAQRTGYKQDDTQRLVRTFVDTLGHHFEESEPVLLSGFGTFDVKMMRTARKATTI